MPRAYRTWLSASLPVCLTDSPTRPSLCHSEGLKEAKAFGSSCQRPRWSRNHPRGAERRWVLSGHVCVCACLCVADMTTSTSESCTSEKVKGPQQTLTSRSWWSAAAQQPPGGALGWSILPWLDSGGIHQAQEIRWGRGRRASGRVRGFSPVGQLLSSRLLCCFFFFTSPLVERR